MNSIKKKKNTKVVNSLNITFESFIGMDSQVILIHHSTKAGPDLLHVFLTGQSSAPITNLLSIQN